MIGIAASVWMVVCPASARGGESAPGESRFEQANRSYEQGRFEEAAEGYRALLRSGQTTAAVYFNLGNACFKLGQIGRAIANYRLALEHDPRDPDLLANLRFARDQAGVAGRPAAGWRHLLSRLTLNEWTGLAAAAFWILLLLLALGQWRPAWKPPLRVWRRVAGLALVLGAVCLGISWNMQRRPWAVVVAPEAEVRHGPLAESQPVFTARDGAELVVTDRKGDWVKVADASRRTGWIHRDQVVMAGVEQGS